jgi:ribosome maturation factor RimP
VILTLEFRLLELYSAEVVVPSTLSRGGFFKPAPFSWKKPLGKKSRLEIVLLELYMFGGEMNALEDIARDVLEPMGYEVLEVVVSSGRVNTTLVVRIDRLDEQPVTVEDLTRASNVFSLELDHLDPIQGEYQLELESPGPKRPLVTARHFERHMGLKIKVKRQDASVIGTIVAVTPEAVTLELETKATETITLNGIRAYLAEWPDSHR